MVKKSSQTIHEQIAQKREELTQALIAQTNAYSEYMKVMKVMKAKSVVSNTDTEKITKLDKLVFDHFNTYRHALEDAQKLLLELSELEDILGE